MGVGRFTGLVLDVQHGELEIQGGTTVTDAAYPPMAIHVAVVQTGGQGVDDVSGVGVPGGVPGIRVPDSTWEARIHAPADTDPTSSWFRAGEDALVLGLMITFRAPDETTQERGGFEAFSWSQVLTIEAGELCRDPSTYPPTVDPPLEPWPD